jgi:hypothetical protein
MLLDTVHHHGFSEEATNFKARSIALASALKIEPADGIRAE